MIILPVWSSSSSSNNHTTHYHQVRSEPEASKVQWRNPAQLSPRVDYGVPYGLRSEASSQQCRHAIYHGFIHHGDRPLQTTHLQGWHWERVCRSWMFPSWEKSVPSMTHCVIEKTSLRSQITSGTLRTPMTGGNIVSIPKYLQEAPNHRLRRQHLPRLW